MNVEIFIIPHYSALHTIRPTIYTMKGVVYLLLFSLAATVSSNFTNPLEGKHLVVGSQITVGLFYLNVIRNDSGYITDIDGVAAKALAALSQRFHFTYSFLQVKDNFFEKQSDSLPGLAYYQANGKCDLIIGAAAMTNNRFAMMDLAEGFAYTNVALVIPMPESSDNSAAIIRPFQISVWIILLVSLPIAAVVVYFCIRQYSQRMDQRKALTLQQTIFELLRVTLNQGGNFRTLQRQSVYLVAGSWCLTSFVLVCAYNSILISYILGGSNAEPIVNSLVELADNSKIQLAVDKGFNVDVVLSAAKDGVYKQLGDKLRSNPKSRCVKQQECIDLVKSESYAYLHGTFVDINAIDEDFKVTNTCRLALARKTESMPGSLAWSLIKKSPHTKDITKGFMELHQVGLIDHWTRMEVQKWKNAEFCLNMAKEKIEKKSPTSNKQTRITLKNFTGAFYVLIIGFILSFICFVFEHVSFRLTKSSK